MLLLGKNKNIPGNGFSFRSASRGFLVYNEPLKLLFASTFIKIDFISIFIIENLILTKVFPATASFSSLNLYDVGGTFAEAQNEKIIVRDCFAMEFSCITSVFK